MDLDQIIRYIYEQNADTENVFRSPIAYEINIHRRGLLAHLDVDLNLKFSHKMKYISDSVKEVLNCHEAIIPYIFLKVGNDGQLSYNRRLVLTEMSRDRLRRSAEVRIRGLNHHIMSGEFE